VTADLHWGHRRGQDAVRLLADYVAAHPPDVLLLAGDVGSGDKFDECLSLFDRCRCRKALVPGNHDIWVHSKDQEEGIDSLTLYRERLPAVACRHGFHYLDQGPLYLPEADLAVVGSINWYDYSWGLDGLRRNYPAEEHRLQSKRLPKGRLNDFNYVRWDLDDQRFTAQVVETMARHLEEALDRAARVVVVTHHPPFYTLGWKPKVEPVTLNRYLWDSFIGNQALEDLLERYSERIAFAFCGHTHQEREGSLGGIRGYNIGGDYHFKRLLVLDWPEGTITAHQFGDPNVTG
jgi:3',5'-cyclic AMP phosphodiesterase CpdA